MRRVTFSLSDESYQWLVLLCELNNETPEELLKLAAIMLSKFAREDRNERGNRIYQSLAHDLGCYVHPDDVLFTLAKPMDDGTPAVT